jgi:hypothetical protein
MQAGLSFVFVAIAVRILGTADYGLFRQVVQAMAIIGQAAELAVAPLVRLLPGARPRGERASPQSLGSRPKVLFSSSRLSRSRYLRARYLMLEFGSVAIRRS